jgi:hypothetical protein
MIVLSDMGVNGLAVDERLARGISVFPSGNQRLAEH